jgi:hypothetical protein
MTLAERARETFPFVVKVRAHRPAAETSGKSTKGHRGWDELYSDYYRREHPGEEPPDELLILLREVLEEAADATP